MRRRMMVWFLICCMVGMTGCGTKNNNQATSEPVVTEAGGKISLVEEVTDLTEDEEDNTEAVTEDKEPVVEREEILIDDYSILDMILFARIMYEDDYTACELLDFNGDGCPELGVEKYWPDGSHKSQYIFNSWKSPSIYVYSDDSASGDSFLYVDPGKKEFYLFSDYATAGYYAASYSRYMDRQWETVKDFVCDNLGDEQAVSTFESELNSYAEGIRRAENHYDELIQLRTTDDMQKVQSDIEQFLQESGRQYESECVDLDNDGSEDVIIWVKDYLDAWLQNVTQSLDYDREEFRWEQHRIEDDIVIIASADQENMVNIQIDQMDKVTLSVPPSAYRSAEYVKSVVCEYRALHCWDYDINSPDYEEILYFLYEQLACLGKVNYDENSASKKSYEEVSQKYFGYVIPYENMPELVVSGKKVFFPRSCDPVGLYPSPYVPCIIDMQRTVDGDYLVCYNSIRYDIFSMDYQYIPAEWSEEFAADLEGKYKDRLWKEGKEYCILRWTGSGYILQKRWKEN